METIVVYNSNVEALLEKAGYRVGLTSTVNDTTSQYVVKCWFNKSNVINVYFCDNIAHHVKHCNTGTMLYTSTTTFGKFFDTLKEFVLHNPITEPSLVETFNHIAFEESDDYTTKLDKIEDFRAKMNNDFAGIFAKEIADWERSTCGVNVEPVQFQFYRHKYEYDLYYVSEVFDATVLLHDVSTLMRRNRILSLRELSNSYTEEKTSEAPEFLVRGCLGAFEEIVDPNKLVETLSLLGYNNLDALGSIQMPANLTALKIPMQMDTDSLSRSIYFQSSNWHLSVNAFSLAGYCHLDCVARGARTLVDCNSIRDAVAPSMFERFVASFFGSFLIATNFVLNDMPEIRTHLHTMLKAMETIQPPTDLNYNAKWEDFDPNAFDPVEYLETKYQADVSKLPTASVRNCKNAQECDALYNDLHYLLNLD